MNVRQWTASTALGLVALGAMSEGARGTMLTAWHTVGSGRSPASALGGHQPGPIRLVPGGTVANEPGVTCAMLPAGIRAQESGGDRHAVSSLGAIGPDQIMPGNVGPWTKEATGRAASVAEFRDSPALQDRTARFKIGQYCAAYGPRGAAAAWYSGRPGRHRDYRPNPNRSGPSVGAYVDSVMALARRKA